MKPLLSPVLALLAAVAVTGCTSPQARRGAEYPAVLAALSADAQDKVLNGVVEEGFTADMVYIAVGKPSQIAAGDEGGRHIEVWTYPNMVPVSYTPRRAPTGNPKNEVIPQSRSLSQWGNSSLPSGPSSKGDMVSTPRGSGGTGGMTAEVTVYTMKLLIGDGKVLRIRYER